MGQQTLIHGFIAGITWRGTFGGTLVQKNAEALAGLPASDQFPPLTRDMVGTSVDVIETYFHQVIHIGLSLKNLDEQDPVTWSEWLAKFESLLRKTYWLTAQLHIHMELWDEVVYLWEADPGEIDRLRDKIDLAPIQKWRFLRVR